MRLFLNFDPQRTCVEAFFPCPLSSESGHTTTDDLSFGVKDTGTVCSGTKS